MSETKDVLVKFESRIDRDDLHFAIEEFKKRLPVVGEFRPALFDDLREAARVSQTAGFKRGVTVNIADEMIICTAVEPAAEGVVATVKFLKGREPGGDFVVYPRLVGKRQPDGSLKEIKIISFDYGPTQDQKPTEEGAQE